MKKYFIAAVLLYVSLMVSYNIVFAQQSTPVLLSKAITGNVVTTSDGLFWLENNKVLGYYNQTTVVLSNTPLRKTSLASDGKTLVWLQNLTTIQGYDLKTRQEFKVMEIVGGITELALDQNILYYSETNGLYAFNLTTKQSQLLSKNGQKPVAHDGLVAWQEEKYLGKYEPSEWTLHFSDNNKFITQLAKAQAEFEVSLSAETIVWVARPPAHEKAMFAYNLSQKKTELVSPKDAHTPFAYKNNLAWLEQIGTTWSIRTVNPLTKSNAVPVKPSTAKLALYGLVGTNGLAFGVNSDGMATQLYLGSLEQENIVYQAKNLALNSLPVANPLECGQVYRMGYNLADCNGRWKVDGVQFLLPDFGINGHTFWDVNYAESSAETDYWLNAASTFLAAKTLRIFVDMPYDALPGPTSPATIYDFAMKAAAKGMRIGVVLHNDSSWTLTQTRKQWLTNFITYFESRNALAAIAYLSADNELNNHCVGNQDCYDNNPLYVERANLWVADFTTYVKSLNPNVLVTVGMSTEKSNADNQAAVYNFFRTSGGVPTLAESVDFLAPHNYGAGGYSIWPTLRYTLNYDKPIVLEEYGYATDHVSANIHHTEGEAICRENPYEATCEWTAPYFVEVNARSMRENTFDGFSGGSAWMLADSDNKDCNSPSDFYTGLFASGVYPVCERSGTQTTVTGEPKATGLRIRYHHVGAIALPPIAPSNLALIATSVGDIKLTWDDNSSTETEFVVERKTEAYGNWLELAHLDANVTNYLDTARIDGKLFYYRVRAYARNGGYSAYSNEDAIIVNFAMPTNLVASSMSDSQIMLRWTDKSRSEIGYRIERKVGGQGNWQSIATVEANVTSYLNINLVENQFYWYRVQAYNDDRSSAYTPFVDALTWPLAPTNLQVVTTTATSVNMSWNDNSTGESGYRVERKSGTNWLLLAQLAADSQTYTDANLWNGITYEYRVRTYNTSSNSSPSNEIVAKTLFPAPSNLNLNSPSIGQLNLNWLDNSNSETGFVLERRKEASSWGEVARISANRIFYHDMGLESATTYFYRLNAINASGVSSYTEVVSGTTQIAPNFIVTSSIDNGSQLTATLSYALANATSGQTILIAPSDGNILVVSGLLPPVAAGVTLVGGCGTNGPIVTISSTLRASSLILNGGTTVYGLKLNRLPIKLNGLGNELRCVNISTNP